MFKLLRAPETSLCHLLQEMYVGHNHHNSERRTCLLKMLLIYSARLTIYQELRAPHLAANDHIFIKSSSF